MEDKTEEVKREFDKILEDLKHMEAGGDIQKTEEEIFSMIGRILKLSTSRTSNVCKNLK
jgi:hypothetical protein